MNARQSLQSVQSQLARYYLNKLRTAEAVHQLGYEHCVDGLALWDQEWSQIRHWGNWSIAHAEDGDEFSHLARDYALAADGIFRVRQHPRERLEWLEAGLEAAQRLSDTESELAIRAYLGKSYSQLGQIDEATAFYNRALDLARKTGNRRLESQILVDLGGVLYLRDEYKKSKAVYEAALDLCTGLGLHVEISRIVNGLGNLALAEGDNNGAHQYYVKYLEISEAHGDTINICMALRNLSMTARRLGDFDASKRHGERSVSLCREIGYQYCLAESLAGLSIVASAEGRLTDARDLLLQSLDVSRLISNRSNEAWVLTELGYLSLCLGDARVALDYLEAGFAAAAQIEERWYMAISLLQMVEVYRLTERLEIASEKLREGLEIAVSMEGGVIATKYLLAAALVWHDRGEYVQAAEWAGLIEPFPTRFSTEQRKRYDELVASLSVKLDQEAYRNAFERGKTLTVSQAAQAILIELRKR